MRMPIRMGLAVAALVLAACHPAKPPHNEELQKIRDADQAARQQQPPDFSGDPARKARVLALVAAGDVRTGLDYCNAALVMQHGSTPEDYLLAHELAVASLAQGHLDCRWLAAASEDRFLGSIDRRQRFGTQFRCSPAERTCAVAPVDPQVTDTLRAAMAVPPLADSAKRGAELGAQMYPAPAPSPVAAGTSGGLSPAR